MLSATAVAQARPQPRQYKLWDERGLYLLVIPNGRRYWCLNYRLAGKAKTISLGIFPDVGLAVARTSAMRPERSSRSAKTPARSSVAALLCCRFGSRVASTGWPTNISSACVSRVGMDGD
ncbi:MAG: DUF4102 domain-containing protein [Sphingopyxis sp.]|nr:DUF4102 domain-containing protein [Sphingopyxis sp.]